jgi:hypothetical protein
MVCTYCGSIISYFDVWVPTLFRPCHVLHIDSFTSSYVLLPKSRTRHKPPRDTSFHTPSQDGGESMLHKEMSSNRWVKMTSGELSNFDAF